MIDIIISADKSKYPKRFDTTGKNELNFPVNPIKSVR